MITALNTATAIAFTLAFIGAVSIRKVGGIWFWRIGRIGGSFYVARQTTGE